MNKQEYEYAGAPPLALPSERADFLDKIQPNLIVDTIYHNLMGEVEINGTWVKDPELQDRALTKKGAWDIRTLMTPVSSQNVSLSKLKDGEIKARLLRVTARAQEMCLTNWREYGIRQPAQLGFVHEIIFSNTLVSLKQPEGEGIRKMIMNTTSAEIGDPMPEQKGIANWFRK